MSEDSEFEALWQWRLALSRIQREVWGLKAILKGRRVAMEEKYNFNPSQPRVPAGSPDGGQWTGGGNARLSRTPPVSIPTSKVPTASSPKPFDLKPTLGRLALSRLARLGSPLSLTLMLSGDTPQPILTARVLPGTTDLAFIHKKSRTTGKETGEFARVITPERQVPFRFFGIETPVPTIEPARTEKLPVQVTITNGYAVYNAAELEKAYGRSVPGLTRPTSLNKPPVIAPGSGIEVRDDEE